MPEGTITLPPPAGTPPAGAPPAGTPPAGTPPAFSIPDAYKDRPYLKGVDSVDKVYEMLDGSQKLLGQRPAGIPGPDAKPEEIEKFYSATRPKTAAEYQFEIDPSIKADEKVIGKMKDLMFKHGLTPAQAKGMQYFYFPLGHPALLLNHNWFFWEHLEKHCSARVSTIVCIT